MTPKITLTKKSALPIKSKNKSYKYVISRHKLIEFRHPKRIEYVKELRDMLTQIIADAYAHEKAMDGGYQHVMEAAELLHIFNLFEIYKDGDFPNSHKPVDSSIAHLEPSEPFRYVYIGSRVPYLKVPAKKPKKGNKEK